MKNEEIERKIQEIKNAARLGDLKKMVEVWDEVVPDSTQELPKISRWPIVNSWRSWRWNRRERKINERSK